MRCLMVWTKMLLKMTLVSGLAGGFIIFSPPANAVSSSTSCYQNVDKWEDKLERDISRHGSHSWRARHDRHELAEARQSCQRRYGNNWREHSHYSYDKYRRWST